VPPDPTAPPGSLDATSKTLYRKVRATLREQDTWKDTDRELLVIYVQSLELARKAAVEIAKEGVLVIGAKDALVANPAIAVARGALRDATEAAKELLLTPRARRQYEIEVREQVESKFGL